MTENIQVLVEEGDENGDKDRRIDKGCRQKKMMRKEKESVKCYKERKKERDGG